MKRKYIIILYLAIFLITEAIFFINIWELNLPVFLAALFAAALVSAAWSSVVYLLVYLLNKRSANRA